MYNDASIRRSTGGGTRSSRRRAKVRRRRLMLGLTALLVATVVIFLGPLEHAVREITLPLRHEDIIRQQARQKDLDPAMLAAVIYAESHFRDGQVSSAGAQGLMQLTPDTAKDIARKSGGIDFAVQDLGTPQVNISYGAYYLRYLLDRYGGNETFAATTRRASSTKPPTSRPRTLRRTVTTSSPFSLAIIDGPSTWRMSATCASGTCAPFGAVMGTPPRACGLARDGAA